MTSEDYERALVMALYKDLKVDEANEELYNELTHVIEGKPIQQVIDTIKVLLMSACKDGIEQARGMLSKDDINELKQEVYKYGN